MYTCEKCNKIFKFPYLLKRHQDKKNDCGIPTCDKCGKTFTRPFGLKKHLKRKKDCETITMVIDKSTNIGKVDTSGDHNNLHIGDVKNITNNITNNITQNINIRPFGKENTSYITPDMMKKIEWSEALPVLLFKLKNLDPKHPENHNVTISNYREKIGLVKTRDGWKKDDLDTIVRDIFNYQEYDIDLYFKEQYDEKRHLNVKTQNIARVLNSLATYLEDDYMDDDIKIMSNKIIKELMNTKKMVLESKRKFDRKEKILSPSKP